MADRLSFKNPGFLIIGAQRCGTTSLFRALIRHPQIRPPQKKEIHFFDDNHGLGLDWYRSHFPPVGLFDGLITGEASPYYLFHPRVPARVSGLYPDIKLIVLMRNPVDRAYSHYHHNIRRQRETRSFEEALAMEASQLEGEEERLRRDPNYQSPIHKHFSYAARGVYVRQIRQWLDYFPRQQFVFLHSEDYFRHPQPTLARVFEFLGVRPDIPCSWPEKPGHGYEPMGQDTRAMLTEVFRPFNQELYSLLDQDYRWNDPRILEGAVL